MILAVFLVGLFEEFSWRWGDFGLFFLVIFDGFVKIFGLV